MNKKVFVLMLALFTFCIVQGQGGGNGPGGGGPPGRSPIDGGLIVLAIAGTYFGVKKLKN